MVLAAAAAWRLTVALFLASGSLLATRAADAPSIQPVDPHWLEPLREPAGPSSRRTGIAITEIMYHPADRPDDRLLEFVELYNSNDWPEDIGGYRLAGDLEYTFPRGTTMPARGYVVVAASPADLEAVTGFSSALGPFAGRLPNSGGVLELRNELNALLLEVEYADDSPFPVAADGAGHSLVLARPSFGESHPRAWAASHNIGGSPGAEDPLAVHPWSRVAINEFLARGEDAQPDFVELYNYSTQAVDLTGCVLTDDPGTNRFVFPPGAWIPAAGFVALGEADLGFALSSQGETIYLKSADGARIIDAVRFGGQAKGVSTGRFPDGAQGFHELGSITPGEPNTALLIRPVAFNEIMYNPISGNDDDEFVEIHNRGPLPIDVSYWRLNDAIEFTLPPGTVIPADGCLAIARNAARLLERYPGLGATNLLGNFRGRLANSGERIALEMPDEIVTTDQSAAVTNRIYITVDEVRYSDGGAWGSWSDGKGSSLELIDPRADNRLAANWADSDDTAKSPWTPIEHTGRLDLGRGVDGNSELHVMLLGAGECLVDDLEVFVPGGANNLVSNGAFDSGLTGWIIQGNHVRSALASEGYQSARSLHLRATSGGDNGANRLEINLPLALTSGTATIRGRARWLRGHPDLLLRLYGNYLEAPGTLAVPTDLGTPGRRNSRAVDNAGPAISRVAHYPVVPAGGQAVTVVARIADVDGVAGVTIRYRVDPQTTYSTLAMTDRGAGLYSATLPAYSSGVLVAYYIEAADQAPVPAARRYPASAPDRECHVRFGDPTPPGGFGVYRLWVTSRNISTWTTREKLSNEPLDATFVYRQSRIIHQAGGRYRGSPFIRPNYTGPTGASCAYVWDLPKDDPFLNADELNLDSLEPSSRDSTALREMTAFWMARQLGLPGSYQRFVHVILNGVANSSRGIPIYSDTQQPDSDYVRGWFADDSGGQIFKIDDWFEFNDSVGMQFNENAHLQLYLTTDLASGRSIHKQARYRWSWERKFNGRLDDDYSALFRLADIFNGPDATYVEGLENTIDAEEWITAFALRHVVGDWDGYGYNRGKNTFLYRPNSAPWRLLLWDLDFSLGCNGGHGPTQNIFTVEGGATEISRLYNHPHFRRVYFRALQRAVDGPLLPDRSTPIIQSRYQALQANNVTTVSPLAASGAQNISIPEWIRQRREFILGQIPSASFAITSNSGASFATNRNYIRLTGTAPVAIRTLRLNGQILPLTWTSVTSWAADVVLEEGANDLTLIGYDFSDTPVPGATDTISVHCTGAAEPIENHVVIHEIMYQPAVPGAGFVELHNTSAQTAFDLGGLRLSGIDFTFPDGTLIVPGGFLLVAEDRAVFANTYGNAIPLAGQYAGRLDPGGETLRLIRPADSTRPELVVDQVTYDDDPPWPAAADGRGPSLQLVDPLRDNNRAANWTAIDPESAGQPPALTNQSLIPITHSWSYDQSGSDLGKDWKEIDYPAAGQWPAGPALLYAETAALPAPKNTPLTIGPRTFYFRTEFAFAGDPAHYRLQLRTVIDDGAVFYLNGREWHRFNMRSGNVDYLTLSQSNINNAVYQGPVTLTNEFLRPGRNVLAVEIHQGTANSTDIVFGMTLDAEPLDALVLSPFTPGKANSGRSSLPEFPPLRLNEIVLQNLSGPADSAGDRDPWIEIFNAGSDPISMDGFYLGTACTNLLSWAFPADAAVPAGGFLQVWLDAEPTESTAAAPHADLTPIFPEGMVLLSRLVNTQTQMVDYLSYRPIPADRSFGAYPDGETAGHRVFHYPTPGATNNPAAGPANVLFNEWMPQNNGAVPDPADSDFDDWFELYNADDTTIDLTGFYLTDDPARANRFVIPAGVSIPARGFLLVWADQETWQNSTQRADLHVNFQLDSEGESLALLAPDDRLVDAIEFGVQTNQASQGRYPDGAPGGEHLWLTSATPGQPNHYAPSNQPPRIEPIADRSVAEGALLSFPILAADPDPGQSLAFRLDPGAPAAAAVHPDSGLFSWMPGELDGPGRYALTVRVSDNGEPPQETSSTFCIDVAELNQPPVLDEIASQYVRVSQPLEFSISASDPDYPAQALAFDFATEPPPGASLSEEGRFQWTPGPDQGPATYEFTVRVTDRGDPPLSHARTFELFVLGPSQPPRLTEITVYSDGVVAVTWTAEPGQFYQARFTEDLLAPAWQDLGAPRAAEDFTMTVTDMRDEGAPRFYQVIRLR